MVGWATADHLRTDLVAQALDNAVRHRRPDPGVIFHADKGCQYPPPTKPPGTTRWTG
ncbi:hypothetical protein ACIQMJ_08425 [Actinosynnema sp. NPDC091369]